MAQGRFADDALFAYAALPMQLTESFVQRTQLMQTSKLIAQGHG
jgi:hypothetical protein